LHRRVAAAVEHELRVRADQARRVDAQREQLAGRRVARAELGRLRIAPAALHESEASRRRSGRLPAPRPADNLDASVSGAASAAFGPVLAVDGRTATGAGAGSRATGTPRKEVVQKCLIRTQ